MCICQKVELTVSLETEHFVGLWHCTQQRWAELCVCMYTATKAGPSWLKVSVSITPLVKKTAKRISLKGQFREHNGGKSFFFFSAKVSAAKI